MKKTLEITVVCREVKFRFDNSDGSIVVIDCDWQKGDRPEGAPKFFSAKGPDSNFEDFNSYRLFGFWGKYTNKRTGKTEDQFIFTTAIPSSPHTQAGVITYLTTHGKGLGVGVATARKLYEVFGANAVQMVREKPDVASAAAPRLTLPNAEELSVRLTELSRIEDCSIELLSVLSKRKFPKTTANKCLSKWGNLAAEIVQKNPYNLLAFTGCGWKLCNLMYLDLGLPRDRRKRQTLCGYYAMKQISEGHTWFPIDMVRQAINDAVKVPKLADAVKLGERAGIFETIRVDSDRKIVEEKGRLWIAEGDKARNEGIVVGTALESINEFAAWPGRQAILAVEPRMTEHQLDKLIAATTGTIGVFGGSPGTGKTFSAAALVKAILATNVRVAVAAPTGKAAVRITDALQQSGLEGIRARTIHSLLVVERTYGGGWKFRHSEENPLPFRFIIVDECFPVGTLVDTPRGRKAIETILPGQRIYNAFGVDRVSNVCKKEVDRVVKITSGEKEIYCSENHRFFTARGFVGACNLAIGDSLVQTEEAVRLLHGDNTAFPFEPGHEKILQSFLLNEMVDAVPGIQEKDIYKGKKQEMRRQQETFSTVGNEESEVADREDCKLEADEQSSMSRQGFSDTEKNETSAADPGGQRSGNDKTAENTSSCLAETAFQLGVRVDCPDQGSEQTPKWNQTGHRQQVNDDLHRMRWSVSRFHQKQREGCKKGCVSVKHRVDCVEVLESRDSRLDQFRDAEGKLYLYDIKAERHQSYSVEGLLVHNSSMVDTDLLSSLLRARARGVHILLVGDVNQLPPVGHGAPLRDLIDAKMPYGELTQIKRNSGRIVHACAEIRDMKPFQVSAGIDLEIGENLVVAEAHTVKQQIDSIRELYETFTADDGVDQVWDVQVVVPLNKNSDVSRMQLNDLLQEMLNSQPAESGHQFRLYDKVVNTENRFFPPAIKPQAPVDDIMEDFTFEGVDLKKADAEDEVKTNERGEIYVANGEVGKIILCERNLFHVQLTNPDREVKVIRGQPTESEKAEGNTGCTWQLGYALSVHKAQGSEWPVVIVVIDEHGGARHVCDRSWIYTAISRAKELCILVGKLDTARRFCRHTKIHNRQTFLANRILYEHSRQLLADI